jgi:hypothetical protein
MISKATMLKWNGKPTPPEGKGREAIEQICTVIHDSSRAKLGFEKAT